MLALREPDPGIGIAELSVVERECPWTLAMRHGAADLTVLAASHLAPGFALYELKRGLAHDPWNLAYRRALASEARLTASPPAKGVNPGGTEDRP